MKKNNIVIVLVALLALFGCKDKMRELNTNWQLISDTEVKYMFTGAFSGWQHIADEVGNGQFHILMQYISNYQNAKDSSVPSYRNPTTDNEVKINWLYDQYNDLFNGRGNKIQSIITYIDEQIPEQDQAKYADVRAICEGMLAYMQYMCMENFEATVYDEAFKAISEGISKPHYQVMEDLWEDVMEKLDAAVKQLSSPMAANVYSLGEQDFFTGWRSDKLLPGLRGVTLSKINDWSAQRAQWMKFFNMTRLEIAWKLEGQIGTSKFEQIFNDVKGVSNGYFNGFGDGFYFYTQVGTGSSDANIYVVAEYCYAQPFINLLIKNNDPRLPLIARPSGATEATSSVYAMMKDYFQDSLDRYPFLDGKHPYFGIAANPDAKQISINANPDSWVSKGVISFNNLKNPNKDKSAFKYTWWDGYKNVEVEFCPQGEETFNVSLLIGSELTYRNFLVCSGKNHANHDYKGNGIRGLGQAYKYELQADGDATADNGSAAKNLHLRRAEFSYQRQCFLLAMIGKEFGGKSKEEWYKEGMKTSLEMTRDEAHRMAVQAYTGGDQFSDGKYDRRYPEKLTQVMGSGDVTFEFPYTYDDAAIDAYVAAHPYSKENLLDQFYIWGFYEPNIVYSYWRKTGLPEFKVHATPQAADAEAHIYLEKPTNGNVDLTVPRRCVLIDRNTLNENYAEIKEYLLNNPNNPNYGDWLETDGKTWWEDCAAYPTGWAGIK